MSRKVSAPIMFSNLSYENRAEYAKQMKETGTDRVFISVNRSHMFAEDTKELLGELSDHMNYFDSQGLEVGIWIQVFGFGNELTTAQKERCKNMTKIRSVTGKECGDAFCPEDPRFMEIFCSMVTDLAALKPALLMLDDDLCLSVRPGIGCFCHRHQTLLEQRLGRPVPSAEELFTGKGDELRKGYLSVMGDTLREFCRRVRATVDAVDPDIRLGFCAGYTSWDLEGADAIELSRILSGTREPFLRFTGAPYWAAPHMNRFPGQRLHGIIEMTRVQEAWCRGTGIECFSEADSYPRPRYHVPGNLVECFDTALVASGNMGTLKYFFDYFSEPTYETGYVRLHGKNAGLRAFLEEHFDEKQAWGIRVFESKQKIADMELPEEFSEHQVMYTALPVAAAMLTSMCIPVCYEADCECAIAFGENAKDVRDLPKRMILDMVGAQILQERGLDLGFVEAHLLEKNLVPATEVIDNHRISLTHPGGRYFECRVKDSAKVLSYFELEDKKIPAAYTYKKGATEFLVFTFDAYSINQSSSVFCSYARQQQILDFYSDYPVIRNSPFVYQLCKRGEKETVAFFANIFEDEMWDFEIELDRVYQAVECYGIEAGLQRKALHVNSVIPAYGMFAVRLIE